VGNRGWRGHSPLPGGLGDVPPKTKRGGELPALATPPRVGPKTLANPQPTRVGNRGWRGHSPLPGGLGDVPPRTLRRGRVARISNPATSGTKSAGEPKAYEGGQSGGPGGASPHVECYATLRGLYWRASAMWWGRISCEPSRSAMVRASLSTL